MLQPRRGIVDPIGSPGREPRRVDGLDLKIGMRLQKRADHALVFLRRKGTGRVDEPSAAAEHFCRAVQNFLLPVGAHRDRFLAPVGHCGFLLAEHSLAGARRVDQNFIEPAREPLREPSWMLAQHQRVRHAQPLHIPG